MRTRAARSCLLVLVLSAACATTVSALGVREGKLYDAPRTEAAEPIPIVPGESVGPVAFDMTKEQVFKLLGNPDTVYYGDTRFSLRDKPMAAYYVFRSAGLSILFQWEQMAGIWILSEQYELPGGIRVGMDVARAEEVLGPLPDDLPMSMGTEEKVIAHPVWRYGGSGYRIAMYEDRHLWLKVDVETSRVLEMKITPASVALAPVTEDLGEPVSEQDARSIRTEDAQSLSGTGIALDRYALVVYSMAIQPAGDTFPSGTVYRFHQYSLKNATQAEIAAQEASFIQAVDSFRGEGPSLRDLVSRFGMPLLLQVSRDAGDVAVQACYGNTFVPLVDLRLSMLSFGPEATYRYQGRIGIGSTMDEVFAELGGPIATIASDEPMPEDRNRILVSSEQGGVTTASISYLMEGFFFSFEQGRVRGFSRYWDR